jgi:hypothetical protein
MVHGIVESILRFLNGNSGAIAAVATTAGVIIAAVYTFYTTKLWKVTAQQARSAELQADSAQRQLRLMEHQMAVAEKAFETVHRPHLLIEARVDLGEPDLKSAGISGLLTILAKNYGATAATVMLTECSVPKEKGVVWSDRLLPVVIPPGETEVVGRAALPSPPSWEPVLSTDALEKVMRWFHVNIRYRGLSDSDYWTKGQISLMPDMKDPLRWRLLSVTPTGPEFWEIHQGKNETESERKPPNPPLEPTAEKRGGSAANR